MLKTDAVSEGRMMEVGQLEAKKSAPGFRSLDKLGIILSGACLIHCTVLPMVLALLPFIGAHCQLDHKWHVILTACIVPVALLALVSGWTRHHVNKVLILGSIGLVLILGAPYLHDVVGHVCEEILSTLGGLTLISGHLMNHKILTKMGKHDCPCCHH